MTAYALDYRADQLTVASDSLCYSGALVLGYLSKVSHLPHLRSLFFSRGRLEFAHEAGTTLSAHDPVTH